VREGLSGSTGKLDTCVSTQMHHTKALVLETLHYLQCASVKVTMLSIHVQVHWGEQNETLQERGCSILVTGSGSSVMFESVRRLLHPFMPFVTEELWQVIIFLESSITAFSVSFQKFSVDMHAVLQSVAHGQICWPAKCYMIKIFSFLYMNLCTHFEICSWGLLICRACHMKVQL
jgi:leucyl-tRNA synthetase